MSRPHTRRKALTLFTALLMATAGGLADAQAPPDAPSALPHVPGRPTATAGVPPAAGESRMPGAFPQNDPAPAPDESVASPKSSAPALLEQMRRDPDPEVRARALEAWPLTEARESALTGAFSELDSPDPALRAAARRMVDGAPAEELFAYLMRTLSWGAPERVYAVDAALPGMGRKVESLLSGTLETEIEDMRHRRVAAYCLGRIGNPANAALLVKYAWSEDRDLADACIQGLALLRAPQTVGDWSALLDHEDADVKLQAVAALGGIDTPPARRILMEVATGARPQGLAVQQAAAEQAAGWAAVDAVPALVEILRANTALVSPVTRLLRQKTGKNFGPDPNAWTRWMMEGDGEEQGTVAVE